MISSWFFLSPLNYDARPTTHQEFTLSQQMYFVFCKVLPSIVAVWRVMLCCMFHGGFGVWVPEGKRGFSVFQNIQPAILLVPGALSGGVPHWMFEADPSLYLVLVSWCFYMQDPCHFFVVLLHAGSMPLFPLDFVFFHTELHTVQSLFCLCKSLAVICQLCIKKCNHFAFLVIIIVELL